MEGGFVTTFHFSLFTFYLSCPDQQERDVQGYQPYGIELFCLSRTYIQETDESAGWLRTFLYKSLRAAWFTLHVKQRVLCHRHQQARQCPTIRNPVRKGQGGAGKLKVGYADAWHRDGDLTKLGAQQHREIAHRMYERFPELLTQSLQIDAKSSTSRRCMLSMFNFCQELKRLNPQLDIVMDASKHDMKYVVEDLSIKLEETTKSERYEQQRAAIFEGAHDARRLMSVLFTDTVRAAVFVNGRELMEALYNIAEDLQNVPELNISLMDVFTKDELFNMWQGYNAGWLLNTGLVPGSTPYYQQQQEVLDSIVSTAERVIREGKPTVTLRFSHDSSVLPLAYLLGLKEARGGKADIPHLYKYVSIDKIIPMAANIQIVFYRKPGNDDVLVKFFLNENETTIPVKTDCAPYYHWEDVKDYYQID